MSLKKLQITDVDVSGKRVRLARGRTHDFPGAVELSRNMPHSSQSVESLHRC